MYKNNPTSHWTVEQFGSWDNNKNKLQKYDNFVDIASLRRMNLKGNEIKICYVLTDEDSIHHLTDKV